MWCLLLILLMKLAFSSSQLAAWRLNPNIRTFTVLPVWKHHRKKISNYKELVIFFHAGDACKINIIIWTPYSLDHTYKRDIQDSNLGFAADHMYSTILMSLKGLAENLTRISCRIVEARVMQNVFYTTRPFPYRELNPDHLCEKQAS